MAAAKKTASAAKKRSTVKSRIANGCAHINASFNNTQGTIPDTHGNALS